MKKKWQANPIKSPDLLTQLLTTRGLVDETEVQHFLEPRYEDSPDPFRLEGMAEAVTRIQKAVHEQERVTIYADYDADAVTAARDVDEHDRADTVQEGAV